MGSKGRVPLVGIISDTSVSGLHRYHSAGEKYLSAVTEGADAIPVMIPSLPEPLNFSALLAQLDGLLFTGAYSNVEPRHYHGEESVSGTQHDALRDKTTLNLLPAAVVAEVPVFGICRGFQEMNVAWGGTLHQRLHETGLFAEHREDKNADFEAQYGPAHDLSLEKGSMLEAITGCESHPVNSLHTQGVNQLGEGLCVEARAPDGLIEAISVVNSSTFAMGVQWHPEWNVINNPFNLSIFRAFGDACRQRSLVRAGTTTYSGEVA